MLKDRIEKDNTRVFLNHGHFASWHTWNGKKFQCVTDDETAAKKDNINEISWDNNVGKTLIYVRKDEFPGRLMPNERGAFDLKPVRIVTIQDDMGMLTILLESQDARGIAQ